jgi:hypothetical protein
LVLAQHVGVIADNPLSFVLQLLDGLVQGLDRVRQLQFVREPALVRRIQGPTTLNRQGPESCGATFLTGVLEKRNRR